MVGSAVEASMVGSAEGSGPASETEASVEASTTEGFTVVMATAATAIAATGTMATETASCTSFAYAHADACAFFCAPGIVRHRVESIPSLIAIPRAIVGSDVKKLVKPPVRSAFNGYIST
jgi:hypothetical protein